MHYLGHGNFLTFFLSVSSGCPRPLPTDRVRFILGGEEADQQHQLFTEMDEYMCNEDGYAAWKETARWLKFEEDVEEGGDRWSKPHVATLSLYSLFELRSCLIKGTVLLDMNAGNLLQIAGMKEFTFIGPILLIPTEPDPGLVKTLLSVHFWMRFILVYHYFILPNSLIPLLILQFASPNFNTKNFTNPVLAQLGPKQPDPSAFFFHSRRFFIHTG